MESYVFRPMMTVFWGAGLFSWVEASLASASELGVEEDDGGGGGGRFVTRAKNWRSAFSGGQGREPSRPMPREGVVATMRVSRGRGGG